MTLRSNHLQENLIAYENIFTRFVGVEYPLPKKVCKELKLIQNFMNLSDEEVDAVESYVLKKAGFLSIQTLNFYQDFTKSDEFVNFELQDTIPSVPENTQPREREMLFEEEDIFELDPVRPSFADWEKPDEKDTVSRNNISRIKRSRNDLAVTGLPLLFLIGLIIMAVSPQSLIARIERKPSEPKIDLERERQLDPQDINIETVAKE